MDQRVSLITLGVADLTRSRVFYASLGWKEVWPGCDAIAFFQLRGQVIALYPLPYLMADQGKAGLLPVAGGITLAVNVRTKAEVVTLCAEFTAAGGSVLSEPTDTPRAAITAYAADPDGHPWQLTWLPKFPLNDEDELWLPEQP